MIFQIATRREQGTTDMPPATSDLLLMNLTESAFKISEKLFSQN